MGFCDHNNEPYSSVVCVEYMSVAADIPFPRRSLTSGVDLLAGYP